MVEPMERCQDLHLSYAHSGIRPHHHPIAPMAWVGDLSIDFQCPVLGLEGQ